MEHPFPPPSARRANAAAARTSSTRPDPPWYARVVTDGSRMTRARARGGAWADLALRVLAFVVLVATFTGAVHDVSQAYDSGYYHLPFAARLVGLLPSDVFAFHAANQARFEGFPLLGELMQGLLWRFSGHAPATNLVAFASVPLFAWFLRRRFGVPASTAVLALFAVPLVQTHAASTYVDLPANAALAVVVLLAIQAWTTPGDVTRRTLALALVAGAIAANMKTLAGPLVALGLVALGVRAWRASPAGRRHVAQAIVLLPLVFATPVKNIARHHNPFYPIKTSVLGVALPGIEAPYSSSPRWLASAPQPARFVCSLLEVGARPMSDPRRWSVDQWMPSDADGYRMGGFFGAWVVANVVLLAWRAVKEREGPARRAAAGFLVLTAVVSVMPQSHELRYYLVWMLVLVATNGWLACRAGAPRAPLGPRAYAALSALAMLVVMKVTDFDYVHASGSTFEEVRARKVDADALSRVPDGARVCVDHAPWNLLYAAPFQPGPARRYVVIEAESPEDCGGAPPL